MRKPLIFVARVHGGSSCSPAVALGFESASDGDTVCVTCPTTYQRWKLPKTSVQAHQGVMAKGVRRSAKRYLERISKPSEVVADRVCIVCIVCRAGQIGLGCGHLSVHTFLTLPVFIFRQGLHFSERFPKMTHQKVGEWTAVHIFFPKRFLKMTHQ